MSKKISFMHHKMYLTPHTHSHTHTHTHTSTRLSCMLIRTYSTWTPLLTHTKTTDGECTWTTTQTPLHTDMVGMVTIYIMALSDQRPPNPVTVTMATNSQDRWISQLAILNVPQTDSSLAWVSQRPDTSLTQIKARLLPPPALWLHKTLLTVTT